MIESQSISTNKQRVTAITAADEIKLAMDGLLDVNGRRLLVTRGAPAQQMVGYVYIEFARRLDSNGVPFQFSLQRRSLVETDSVFKQVVKLSPKRMENFLAEWFQFAELVSAGGRPVLILTDKLPSSDAHLLTPSQEVGGHIFAVSHTACCSSGIF
jgi:hypothetical protein